MASLILNRGQMAVNIKEFIASNIEDMNTISLTQVAPGSKCLCLDTFNEYILDSDKVWKTMPEQQTGGANVDLDGYATEEWVNEQIALVLNNPSVDIDSIAELAKVLQEGGADLVAIREAMNGLAEQIGDKVDVSVYEAHVAAQEAKNEQFTAADAELQKEVADFKNEFKGYKNDMANIHNMSAQVDAKLMDDINKNEKAIAEETKAREALAESVAAADSQLADKDAELAQEIADFKEEFKGYKNDMANIHNMSAEVDAKLMDDIHEVEKVIADEVARATAAEGVNATEIARIDTTLKAAIENDGAGIDSIKELASWIEEHGEDAAVIVKSIEDETARAKAAEEANATAIANEVEDRKAAFKSGIEFTQAVSEDLAKYKLAQAELKQEQDKALNNEQIARVETDAKQQVTIDEHDAMLKDIAREGLYRAQEVRPLIDNDTSFAVKYDGATLNLQRRTDKNIVAVRLEGDDVVLRKLSGDSIVAEEITYNHSVEDSIIETGDNRVKPLCLLGLDNYATSESGYKLILDDNNCGIATNSDCSVLNYKEEYANVTPCIKIVDYFYEVVYTNNEPTSLKLLGGFFRKNEAGEFTGTKVGAFADIQHKVHLSFGEGTITIDCSTWPENNGTYRFIEDDKGISVEEPKNFTLAKDDTGYVFAITNLYHSAHIDSLSGEYDVEIRQYDAWHEGHKEGDNPYVSPIVVEYDTILNPCNYPRYYFTKINDRIFFYKAYNESWGWKSGPFGMVITNGEFEKTTNINNPSAAVIKYIIDGNLLITGAYEIQEVTLDELASGRGTVITGTTPYAVNPGTGWGTSDPSVTDNNKRLGMFSYLTDNHDFSKSGYVHPVGNYNVCKIERWPITLVDGTQVQLYEATVRGFETTLHGEHWDVDSENGKMYIQFVAGRAVDDLATLRLFYRTLTVGYDRNEDGSLSTRRRTWSAFTEFTTNTQLNKVITEMTVEFEAVYGKINEISIKADNLYNKAVQHSDNIQASLDLKINEGFARVDSDIAEIKTPLYFGEYTNDEEVVAISDIVKYFRKSNRGTITERIYIHMWIDAFDDNTFAICNIDGIIISENLTELKAIVYANNEGLVGTDNTIKLIGLTENTTLTNTDALYVRPCVGLTVDVPEFRMNTITTIGNYEVDNTEDFTKAILNAGAGATITVNNDITLTSDAAAALVIDKPITIKGNGSTKIATASNAKLFEVYADLTIEGVNLENTVNGGRCIDTRVDGINVVLKDCTISSLEIGAQPITVGGASTNGLNITIDNCQIDAGTGYGIIVFVPVNMTITNSNVHGYAAIYTKVGSEGSVINVNGTNLSSTAVDDIYEFATIVTEGSNVIITLDETNTVSANGTKQHLALGEYLGDDTLIIQGENLYNTFKTTGEYHLVTSANGYVVTKATLAFVGLPESVTLQGHEDTVIVGGFTSPDVASTSIDFSVLNPQSGYVTNCAEAKGPEIMISICRSQDEWGVYPAEGQYIDISASYGGQTITHRIYIYHD